MILFGTRSEICSVETDRQNYMRKHKVKFRTSSKIIPLCVQYILVQCAGADCKVIGVTFITVFVMRRDAACS
jgi:hypothetical protein